MIKQLLLGLALSASISTMASATTIAVSMRRFDDNFLTGVQLAMAAEAKAQNVQISFEDANFDVTKQISQVQNFIAQHVDAIVVVPVDTSATPKITQLAVDAKIPVVYVNLRPEDKVLPPSAVFVGSDDKVSGTIETEEIVRRLGGKGNLVIMEGELDNNATAVRTADVEEVAKKYPGIKIVEKQTADWSRNKAIDLMSNWLSTGEKIDGVVANNDEMAIGAILALKQAGKDPKSYAIGGIDATTDGLTEIANGNLAVTVFQNAKAQGKGGVDAALKLIKGEHVDSFVNVPFELVTKDNYRQYLNNN